MNKRSKASSLQMAQLELMNSAPGLVEKSLESRGATPLNPTQPWSHPYHWAPFVLIGNPR